MQDILRTLGLAQDQADTHEKDSRELLHIPKMGALQVESKNMDSRFLHIEEISEEKPATYQRAMSNILAAAQEYKGLHIIYLLRGDSERVSLYLGVAGEKKSNQQDITHEPLKNLEAALLGHLPGVKIIRNAPHETLGSYQHYGVALGIPTAHEDDNKSDEEDFQGIERLIRAMQSRGRDWQLTLIARPLDRGEIQTYIDHAMRISSKAATWSKSTIQNSSNSGTQKNDSTNVTDTTGKNDSTADQLGKNAGGSKSKSTGSSSEGSSNSTNDGTSESRTTTTGTSSGRSIGKTTAEGANESQTQGVNIDVHNKWNQALLEHLEENLLPRLRKGMNKGLFSCACYLAAADNSTFKLLAAEVKSTFQGDIETTTPIEIYPLTQAPTSLQNLFCHPKTLNMLGDDKALVHSLHYHAHAGFRYIGSLLSVDEVALMASLPRREVPGIIRRKNVDFAVSLPRIDSPSALDMGAIIDHGRTLEQSVWIDAHELDKHVFITGVTGAGKTTTCMKLLLESKLPFLVIEPAKTEYRAMLGLRDDGYDIEIDCYRVGEDPYHTLRINPFQLVHRKQKITAQISMIQATLSAVFPLEASMPQLVEMAIMRAYKNRGWDIYRNENLLEQDPWRTDSTAWPTFSDMIAQLDNVILEQKMGKEFEDKYRGSLVSRLSGLTRGVLGTTLDVPYSMDFNQLIARNVIIELEGLPSPEHKALLMGLILARLAEAMKDRHRTQSGHRHLTLIEEAHRLLARPEPGESDNRKNAVETFANLLSEIRKYGEGLMIADQIPSKLVSDVIKNTHLKIVHRLYAEDDRRIVGEAMMLDDEQRGFLPNLQTGEAIIYRGGWHGAVRAKIKQGVKTDTTPIGDHELDQQSVQLFWRQREALYPHLAAVWSNHEQKTFADFSVHAKTYLNTWLELAAYFPSDAETPKTQIYLQNVSRQLQTWQNLWDNEQLLSYLKALIEDSRPRLRSDKKNTAAWSDEDTRLMLLFVADMLRTQAEHGSLSAALARRLEQRNYRNLFQVRMSCFESF